VVLTRQGKRRLTLMSVERADPRALAEGIDVRGTPSWSPNGEWIVTGGNDAQGPGLFRIPVNGEKPVRLTPGPGFDPVVSPDGNLIVYAGPQSAVSPLLAVRPDSSPVTLPVPGIRVPSGGGGRARFLPSGNLVYMPGLPETPDFWLLDLAARTTRRLARLSNPAATTAFDIAPDGSHIVFDRVREHSDLVLIDLPK
jgi:Tol biopolymer transport system component